MKTSSLVVCVMATVCITADASAQGHAAIRVLAGATVALPADAPVFEGGVGLPVHRIVQITVAVGQIRDVKSSAQDAAIKQLPEFIGAPATIKARFPALYVATGGRFALLPNRRVTPTVEGAVGAARIRADVDASIGGRDFSEEIRDLITGGESTKTKPLVHAGAGVSVGLNRVLRLEAGYRFSHFYLGEGLNVNLVFGSIAAEF